MRSCHGARSVLNGPIWLEISLLMCMRLVAWHYSLRVVEKERVPAGACAGAAVSTFPPPPLPFLPFTSFLTPLALVSGFCVRPCACV
mmetsp:Transcript_42544/g.120702  ORF Transcript_42544/g.120702 Transcript_42544/m.120702 type:complete len:87 (+) Transcript_42544:832-1092(+)